MTVVTKDHTIVGVRDVPELKEIGDWLMYTCTEKNENDDQYGHIKLGELANLHWDPDGIVNGLNNLVRLQSKGSCLHLVYDEAECGDDPYKREIGFLYLEPEKPDPSLPWVVLCAGGAYQIVCTMAESAPVGAALNKLGYKVFAINYRVGGTGVLPRPLDDLNASIRYIRAHAAQFGIDPDNYIVGGFSAGGNLCSLWGTERHGWKKYGQPKPRAMFPVYPVTQLVPLLTAPGGGEFLRVMLGEDYTEEKVRAWSTDLNVTDQYPPCYIVCCKDDSMVDWHNTEALDQCLKKHGIPSMTEIGEKGEHGFGLGTGTDVEGWVKRAAAFERGLK